MSDPTALKDIQFDPITKRMKGTAIHGNTPFDVPFISHIEGNLYTGGCENGLVLPKNIKHLISLYPWESYTIRHELKSKLEVRLYDGLTDATLLSGLAEWGDACVDDDQTLIHCQAGLNRSALVAALVLMKQGLNSEEAIGLLRDKRSPAVLCNRYFEDYLKGRDLE